jgi:hypothetical protein
MEQFIILFGGGDGGGLRFTAHGVEKIPPFGPDVRRQLSAVAKLTHATALVTDGALQKELSSIAERQTKAVFEKLGAVLGKGSTGFAFADGDDTFYCGNGPHPVPVPGPGIQFQQFAVTTA